MRPVSWTLLCACIALAVSCSESRQGAIPPVDPMPGAGAAGEGPSAEDTRLADGGASGAGSEQAAEYCALAQPVEGAHARAAGSDFSEDFGDRVELDGDSCRPAESGGGDALFAVPLRAGQKLYAVEVGGLDAVVSIQTRCSASAECVDSEDEPEDPVATYTAAEDETVYVVAQSFRADPEFPDYAIRIDIDAECGNAIVEADEGCDDDDPGSGDGCSNTCQLEFDYECDEVDLTTTCEELDWYGPYAGDETIDAIERTETVAAGQHHAIVVEFSERVVVSGSVEPSVGNVEAKIYDDDYVLLTHLDFDTFGGQSLQELGLRPGAYRFEVVAVGTVPDGYLWTLETRAGGSCGDGELEPVFEACDNAGAAGCSNCQVDFGWQCDDESPTNCSRVEDLGSFGAGTSVLEFTSNSEDYPLWMVSFDEDVLLSGTFAGMSTNTALVELRDPEFSSLFVEPLDSAQSFTRAVEAGTYMLSARIVGDLSSDGYTLNLWTESEP